MYYKVHNQKEKGVYKEYKNKYIFVCSAEKLPCYLVFRKQFGVGDVIKACISEELSLL